MRNRLEITNMANIQNVLNANNEYQNPNDIYNIVYCTSATGNDHKAGEMATEVCYGFSYIYKFNRQ